MKDKKNTKEIGENKHVFVMMSSLQFFGAMIFFVIFLLLLVSILECDVENQGATPEYVSISLFGD